MDSQSRTLKSHMRKDYLISNHTQRDQKMIGSHDITSPLIERGRRHRIPLVVAPVI